MGHMVPPSHPRYQSLLVREKLVAGLHAKVVAPEGLFAHGRGESLDYFLGEETQDFGRQAVEAAAAALVRARQPVLSVNGNVAALVPEDLVALSRASGAALEVNLFYRTPGREEAVAEALVAAGADRSALLGVGEDASATIPELEHARRRVSPRGILTADLVFVPLEDGDRTQALVAMGKTVITVDLNPLSRTAKASQITIVDNVIRCLPALVEAVQALKALPDPQRQERCALILNAYRNPAILGQALSFMGRRLLELGGAL